MITTPQAALLSEEEIDSALKAAGVNTRRVQNWATRENHWLTSGSQDILTIYSAIEQAILAKLQPAQAQPDANGNTVEFTRAPVIVNPAQEAVNPGPFLASVLVMGHHIEVSAPPGQPIQTGMLGVIRNAVVSYFTTGAATQNPAQAGWSQAGELPDHAVFAVIDSMGWDLDDAEKDDMHKLCRAALARAALAARKQLTDEQVAVLRFLLGESGLDDCYFGDRHTELPGNFWWRKHLRDAFGIGLEVKP